MVCSTALGLSAQQTSVEKATEKPFIKKGTGIISLDVPLAFGFSKSTGPTGQKSNTQFITYLPMVSGGGFVARNFMLGAGVGMMHGVVRTKVPSGIMKSDTPIFLLPSLVGRYYHMFTHKVGFFAQFTGEALLQVTGENAMKLYSSDSQTKGFSLLLSPHMAFFPKPGWGINVGVGEVGYSFARYSYGGQSGAAQTTHDYVFRPTLTFGASYFIGRKV